MTNTDELHGHSNLVEGMNDVNLKEVFGIQRTLLLRGSRTVAFRIACDITSLFNADLYALNTTKDGHPFHPLYQPADVDE